MDWTRGRTIGRGSFATVSIATAHGSGELFAVKSAELSKSESLQREQKILSSLNSPKIIDYRGFNVSSENGELMYNLCLEYAHGGSLSDTICRRGGRLNQAEIIAYTREILIGLGYLHSAGVVHCDIKGRNILVTREGLKIADLGCARFCDGVSGGDWVSVAGTPAYMAPEVARGEQQGFAADVWALGCTVIEMATGRAPWEDVLDPVSAFYRIGFTDDVPEIPSYVSTKAEDFLGKCLKRDPLERWSVDELLKHPFLEEFEPESEPECVMKEFYSFDLDSPRCVLCTVDSENDPNPYRGSVTDTHTGSPAERIRRLSSESNATSFSEMDCWALDEDWVTVRHNYTQEEPDMISLGASSDLVTVNETPNTKGTLKIRTPNEDDLALHAKFRNGSRNFKGSRRNCNRVGTGSSSYKDWGRLRDGKKVSLKCFKCIKVEFFDYSHCEMKLQFFMNCPPIIVFIQIQLIASSLEPFEIL
ncbi:mitogen-activated protein kinase kinase kinase 18-like [Humulus lupulus]|uniref:mitogen-activated protein kinase kinase kinase 18-like n=1 Tax=Humulus lupulus TaxID=3486 RepID=UPI002B411352|nr:mitogen-activated protein kinase kinase kinase 18-like [Humulus lupulus]